MHELVSVSLWVQHLVGGWCEGFCDQEAELLVPQHQEAEVGRGLWRPLVVGAVPELTRILCTDIEFTAVFRGS